MPTPRTVERRPVDETVAEQEAISFRGSSLEDAVAIAEQALGPRIRVVAANRIRRGGIGGFFASDLGVEVNVVLENETIDEALERLVAESDVLDRTQWLDEGSHRTVPPQPEREVIDEPSFLEPRITVPRFADPSRSEPIAAEPAALLDAVSAAVMPRIGRPPVPVPPSVVTPTVIRHRPTPPPSRRQVELAVAAADQLVERLAMTPRVKRLTVKVIVRAGDRREVETEATWEAMS